MLEDICLAIILQVYGIYLLLSWITERITAYFSPRNTYKINDTSGPPDRAIGVLKLADLVLILLVNI